MTIQDTSNRPLLTKEQLEDLIEWTGDEMANPDTDPQDAQMFYDEHIRYIQMLEALNDNPNL